MSSSRGRLARTTVVVALGVALAACGSIGEELTEQAAERVAEAAGGSDVDIEFDDEDGNITVQSEDGTVSIGAQDLPDGVPDELPLPDELDVVSSLSNSTGGTETITFQATTTSSYEDVAALYADGLADAGWTVTGDSTTQQAGLRASSWTIEGFGVTGTVAVTQLGEEGEEDAPLVSLLVSLEGSSE